jgi:hypothetical protein
MFAVPYCCYCSCDHEHPCTDATLMGIALAQYCVKVSCMHAVCKGVRTGNGTTIRQNFNLLNRLQCVTGCYWFTCHWYCFARHWCCVTWYRSRNELRNELSGNDAFACWASCALYDLFKIIVVAYAQSC